MTAQNLPVPSSYTQSLIDNYKRVRDRLNRQGVPDSGVRCVSASVRSGGLRRLLSIDEQKRRLPDFSLIAIKALDWWIERQELAKMDIRPSREKRSKLDQNHNRCPTVILIQYVVAQHFTVPARSMREQGRTRRLSWPRQVAMYLSHTMARESLPQIGRRFGMRDHTTILHGVRRVQARLSQDPTFVAELDDLIDEIERDME